MDLAQSAKEIYHAVNNHAGEVRMWAVEKPENFDDLYYEFTVEVEGRLVIVQVRDS